MMRERMPTWGPDLRTLSHTIHDIDEIQLGGNRPTQRIILPLHGLAVKPRAWPWAQARGYHPLDLPRVRRLGICGGKYHPKSSG